jgi:hypothetical protein
MFPGTSLGSKNQTNEETDDKFPQANFLLNSDYCLLTVTDIAIN